MGVDKYYVDILNIGLNPFWRSPREHNSVAPVFSINPSLGKLCTFPDLNITVPRQVKKLQIEKFPQRTIKELRGKMNVDLTYLMKNSCFGTGSKSIKWTPC